jgi:L-ascorbate metabolism protein UlaG (beta-lactamase superfamily)
VRLQLVRSATVKIAAGGATLLVDPYLAPQHGGKSYAGTLTSPLVGLPMALDELLAGVDAVFVSHLHSDHFDSEAQQRLPKNLPLLCPAPIAAAIREFGFVDVTPIDGELAWRGWTLTLTGGLHGPDAVLEAMGDVHGFVIHAPGEPVLYWVGDSVWCAPVAAAISRHDPDVVVVHACGADWRGIGPLVMDEAQVEAVLRAAPHASVVATHLDVVDHATVSRADLERHFVALPQLAERLRIPADGEVIELLA